MLGFAKSTSRPEDDGTETNGSKYPLAQRIPVL